jgi:hypothetical protein
MLYTVLLAAVPIAIVMLRPRAAVVIVATVAFTWLASAFALSMFDSEDISWAILFIFVLLPMWTVGVAMTLATTLAPRPRMWFDAGFLAMLGWWLGFLTLYLGMGTSWSTLATDHLPLWDAAVLIAAPAIYAGVGAGFGATNKPITHA